MDLRLIPLRFRRSEEAERLRLAAAIFDPEWYRQAYPDVAAAGADPWRHYRRHGRLEGRWPADLQAPRLEPDLWRGFPKGAEERLAALLEHPVGVERALAGWALARWHASRGEWEAAAGAIAVFAAAPGGAKLVPHIGPALLEIEARRETGDPDGAARRLAETRTAHGPQPDLALAEANLDQARGRADPTAALNRLWHRAGLSPVRLREGAAPMLDRLAPAAPLPARSGPRVSVIVPVKDGADTIATALDSLSAQTWRALEILVVDDGSTDATREVVADRAAADPRIRLIATGAPRGVYPARNTGLAAATGAFVTVHDADDWSHPEKIARQVRPLRWRRGVMASVSHWVRATPELTFQRWRIEESWIYRNISSLMIRAELRATLGYWDRVRVSADTEYYHRLRAAYGDGAVREILPGVPLALGRATPETLTQASETHIGTLFEGARRDYHLASRRWHARARQRGDLHLPEQPEQRPFDICDALALGDPPAPLRPDDVIRRSPLFDDRWYRAHHADLRGVELDGAAHYYEAGAAEGRDPSPDFSSSGYALAHGLGPEANPLLHYERTGRGLGAAPLPRFPGRRAAGGTPVLVFGHQAGPTLFGAERSLLAMLERLAEAGHTPVAALPECRAPGYLEALHERAAAIHVLPYPWRRAGRDADPRTHAHLRALIRAVGPAEVHTNTLTLGAPLAAARAEGVATVAHIRELPAEDPALCAMLGASAAELRAWLLEAADRFVANSALVAEWLDAPGRVEIRPNRVDAALFELPFAPADPPRVALIGSNTAKKGVEDFLEVAARAARAGRAAEFRLIGPAGRGLRKRRLPRNVTLAGYAETPAEAMAGADIVLSLSHFAESFGRTVLEAMAAGRPVIAYARGTPRELVADGETGFVVPADDPGAAFAALETLLADPARAAAMGAAGRARAREIEAAGG